MSDIVFNIAKGQIAYYAGLPATSDALILILLKTAASDATLKDFDTFAAVTGGTSVEADFTNYARKTLGSVTVTVDDTNDRVAIDAADVVYTAAGGASNNTLAKAVVCYDGDTGAGDDSNLVPLFALDCVVTTDGTDLTLAFNATGVATAS